MTLEQHIRQLFQELDRIHPDGNLDARALDAGVLPSWCKSESGEEIYFTRAAQSLLARIARIRFDNTNCIEKVVNFEQYCGVFRQSVADCFANAVADKACGHQEQTFVNALRKDVDLSLSLVPKNYTHYFPAWTLGIEATQTFCLGPVAFHTRESWLQTVDFPVHALRPSAPTVQDGDDWRNRVTGAFGDPSKAPASDTLAHDIYRFADSCPSVLAVTVTGSERELSRQRARYICRSALDCLSLLYDDAAFHSRLVLYDEPLLPVHTTTLIAIDGQLCSVGSQNNARGWQRSGAEAADILSECRDLLAAYGNVLGGLLDPANACCPQLKHRWVTALSWFADGCRERNDAVALAKIATSLDVLSCGGKIAGIRGMLAHLTGWSDKQVIAPATNGTLFSVVQKIYDHGRSQILHGNHIDPHRSFAEDRSHATTLARIALRVCVVALAKYSGPDDDKVLRTIPLPRIAKRSLFAFNAPSPRAEERSNGRS